MWNNVWFQLNRRLFLYVNKLSFLAKKDSSEFVEHHLFSNIHDVCFKLRITATENKSCGHFENILSKHS